jgi:flagellar basal-body rod modification protein FlgD
MAVSVASAAGSLAATATGAAKGVEASRKSIADNFEAFLSLLTTQLKNQNPTDPLDTNQFTQQLVQFASVEQQLKTNDLLSGMQKSFETLSGGRLNAATAAGLIGQRVSIDGSTARLDASGATWSVDVPPGAVDTRVTVTDQAGETVYTGPAVFSRGGPQSFRWDGRRTNGVQAKEGETYKVSFQAKDRNGAALPIRTDVTGTATKVDLSGSEDTVTVDDSFTVPLAKVKSVSRAQ